MKRGCRTHRPSIDSLFGTSLSRAAADQRRNADAPGNQGIVARTSTSQKPASSANWRRLNGEESGSKPFGKILVKTKTFIFRCLAADRRIFARLLRCRP